MSPDLVRKYVKAAPKSEAELKARQAEADQIEKRLRKDDRIEVESAGPMIQRMHERRAGYRF